MGLLAAIRDGDYTEALCLIAQGVFVDIVDSQGITPLIYASIHGRTRIVYKLLQQNVDINETTNKKNTALHSASFNGHTDIVRMLIQYNADINATNGEGKTPLLRAVENGHLEVVNILLQYGASTKKRDNEGITPIRLAAVNDNLKIMGAILRHEEVLEAVRSKKYTMVQDYFTKQEVNSSTEKDYSSTLHMAVQKKNFAIIKQLLLISSEVESNLKKEVIKSNMKELNQRNNINY